MVTSALLLVAVAVAEVIEVIEVLSTRRGWTLKSNAAAVAGEKGTLVDVVTAAVATVEVVDDDDDVTLVTGVTSGVPQMALQGD